jgi:hypothetical protein
MKKIILSALFTGIAFTYSQNTINNIAIDQKVKNVKYTYEKPGIQQETGNYFTVKQNTQNLAIQSVFTEEKIGTTSYDLQSNSAIAKRLFNLGNGKLSATWTMSKQLTAGWPDRGTGYNYRDGSNWGAIPSARIESLRTGWPVNTVTQSGKEIVISHDFAVGKLYKNERTTAGSGSWTQSDLSSLSPSGAWPRMASGGANGETIHLIANTLPTGSGGTMHKGMDGALLYSRSTDGGNTWDIKAIQLPGLDSSYYDGIGGDSYSIDAKGNTVAVVVANFAVEPILWKSTDNGTTWTMTKLWDNGLGKYEEANDLIPAADSLPSGDGACEVIIDNNGLVHVFSGIIYFFNEDLTDGGTNFYPNVIDGLVYWNENMGTGNYSIIGGVIDNDNNGTFDVSVNTIPRFGNSNNLNSFPSAGVDANNNLYLVYTSLTEKDDGDEYYRHTYGVKSVDGGSTWSQPVDFTPNDDFAECVFGTAAKMVDSKFYFWYQKGYDPGLNLTSSETNDLEENEIMLVTVDPSDFLTGEKTVSQQSNVIKVYPNPNNGNFILKLSYSNIREIEIYNTLGQSIYNILSTSETMVFDIAEPGIYFVRITGDNENSVQKIIVR